jgi:hypothetical protein
VSAQLAASQEGMSSMELIYLWKFYQGNFLLNVEQQNGGCFMYEPIYISV